MNIKTIIIIAALVFYAQAGSCSDVPSNNQSKTKIEQFIGFGHELFKKPESIPQKEMIETTPNKHNPAQTDEWHTVYYDGLMVKFYRAKSAPKDLLRQIIVTNNKIMMPLGIRIGTKKDAILRELGTPSKQRGEELYYKLPSASYEESVTLRLSNNALIEIRWDYEID